MSPAGESETAPGELETLPSVELLEGAGQDELATLRKDLAKLTQEVADLRSQSHGQVSALAYEVQWLKSHLGGIGAAIQEELSALSSPPPPVPTPPQAQCWAAAAAAAWQATMAQQVQQMMQTAAAAAAAAAAAPAATARQADVPAKEEGLGAASALPQTQQSQSAPENESGRELMTLLRRGSKGSKQAGQQQSEPVKMSLDEFCVWQMQSREDAEGGADVRNAETFGEDAEANWSFEENLAANLRLAEGWQQGHCSAPAWQPLKTHLDGDKAPTSTDSTVAEDEQTSTASSVRSEPSGAGLGVDRRGASGTARRRRKPGSTAAARSAGTAGQQFQ
eukprot:TRINITY_DN25747_c0_g1_i1.p1 TRINITY_DN25747_c0_g1~~TRINITY_DN25747_c0_g1_i1.p1  ORF type:complete len:336 (+),score=98.95 TRINITY_DN25747_c0_g1_i1:90-1097(+)